jgi:tetratricopeptide (TPR) repeat protein
MKVCPKCRQKTEGDQCGPCKLVFADYERQKLEQTGQVYRLISAGELEQAKELAQRLSNEFPDSKGDFILLISNINRDLSIAGKYRQAQELFSKGDYSEAVLLLRNIKAFDPGLSEKIITLRRKAERHIGSSSKFEQAAALFEQKQYAAARTLLQQISSDDRQKQAADSCLAKIEEIKRGRIQEALDCLADSFYLAAQEKLTALRGEFPETAQELAPLFTLLAKRKEISAQIAAAARKAKAEKRHLEAKALYAFLLWQDQELRPALLPHLEEIGGGAVISLADCPSEDAADWADLGLQVTAEGFLKPSASAGGKEHAEAEGIAPVLISLPPHPDAPSLPVHIDGQEVADFTA